MVLILANRNAAIAGGEFLLWHGQLVCKDTQMHSIHQALSYSDFTAITFPQLFCSTLQRNKIYKRKKKKTASTSDYFHFSMVFQNGYVKKKAAR